VFIEYPLTSALHTCEAFSVVRVSGNRRKIEIRSLPHHASFLHFRPRLTNAFEPEQPVKLTKALSARAKIQKRQ
jgi:hypothetical protein